jgi:hypothetical protein
MTKIDQSDLILKNSNARNEVTEMEWTGSIVN